MMYIYIDKETREITSVTDNIDGILDEYKDRYVDIKDYNFNFAKNKYFHIENSIVEFEIPNGFGYEFDYDTMSFKNKSTLEEQLEFWKRRIINLTKEINLHKEAGFYDSSLQADLEYAKKQHMEVSHELAIQINLTY